MTSAAGEVTAQEDSKEDSGLNVDSQVEAVVPAFALKVTEELVQVAQTAHTTETSENHANEERVEKGVISSAREQIEDHTNEEDEDEIQVILSSSEERKRNESESSADNASPPKKAKMTQKDSSSLVAVSEEEIMEFIEVRKEAHAKKSNEDDDTQPGPVTIGIRKIPVSETSWSEANVFKCLYCNKVSKARSFQEGHVKRNGCRSATIASKRGKLVRLTSKTLECKLCEAVVYHDYLALSLHLSDAHTISVSEYGKLTLMHTPEGNPLGSDESKRQNAPKNSSLSDSDSDSEPEVISELGAFTEKEVASESNEIIVVDGDDEPVESPRAWYDGNRFRCDVCATDGALDVFGFKHASAKCSERPALSRVTEKKYACKICAEVVFHDLLPIKYHLINKHRMMLGVYSSKYEDTEMAENRVATPSPESKSVCSICGETVKVKSMMHHFVSYHGQKKGQPSDDENIESGEDTGEE